MTPIKFPEQTHVLAENQPEYEPLPVHIDQNDTAVPMTACFVLTDEEVEEIVKTRKLWHTQLTFGNAFQPVTLSTQSPFTKQEQN